MVQLADHINDQKRKDESIRRLNQVTSRLRGDFNQFRQSVLNPDHLNQQDFSHLKAHAWTRKVWASPVWCFFCNKLIYDGFGAFKGLSCKSCKFPSHRECAAKVPKTCGLLKNMKESLLQHDRCLVKEFKDLSYRRILPTDVEKSIDAKILQQLEVRCCSAFIFNDSMVLIEAPPSDSVASAQPSSSSSVRYSVLCMVRWHSNMTNRSVRIDRCDDTAAIRVVPPRETDVVHELSFQKAPEARDTVYEVLKQTVDSYLSHRAADADRQRLIQHQRMKTLRQKKAGALKKTPSFAHAPLSPSNSSTTLSSSSSSSSISTIGSLSSSSASSSPAAVSPFTWILLRT